MNSARLTAIAERKALLATRAQLDRARLALAAHQIGSVLHPAPDPARRAATRPTAAMIVAFAAPFVGMNRFARWVRIASFAMAAYRVARNWRGER